MQSMQWAVVVTRNKELKEYNQSVNLTFILKLNHKCSVSIELLQNPALVFFQDRISSDFQKKINKTINTVVLDHDFPLMSSKGFA